MVVARGRSRGGRRAGRSGGGTRGAGRREARPASAAAKRLEALADELIDALERTGLRVRHEKLLREVGYHAQSGLCRIGGEEMLILDSDASPEAKVDLLADVLCHRDSGDVDLGDDARAAVDAARRPAARSAAASAGAPDGPVAPAAAPDDPAPADA